MRKLKFLMTTPTPVIVKRLRKDLAIVCLCSLVLAGTSPVIAPGTFLQVSFGRN